MKKSEAIVDAKRLTKSTKQEHYIVKNKKGVFKVCDANTCTTDFKEWEVVAYIDENLEVRS